MVKARFHFILKYKNENMRFIRLLLANQIAYIFRSNDKEYYYVKLLFKSKDNIASLLLFIAITITTRLKLLIKPLRSKL